MRHYEICITINKVEIVGFHNYERISHHCMCHQGFRVLQIETRVVSHLLSVTWIREVRVWDPVEISVISFRTASCMRTLYNSSCSLSARLGFNDRLRDQLHGSSRKNHFESRIPAHPCQQLAPAESCYCGLSLPVAFLPTFLCFGHYL